MRTPEAGQHPEGKAQTGLPEQPKEPFMSATTHPPAVRADAEEAIVTSPGVRKVLAASPCSAHAPTRRGTVRASRRRVSGFV
jgi:hypothetical protein